jgi:uncharacterized membrane protein
MFKWVLAIVTGLVGAALLHVVVILTMPNFTGRDGYTRVINEGESNVFARLSDRPDAAGLANGDPFLRLAVCSFSIAENPVRFLAKGDVPFWSLAIYDQDNNEVFSMTDRTAIAAGALDVIVANAAQMNVIRKTTPDIVSQSILVDMQVLDGYAVLRTLVPLPSMEQSATDFLENADCSTF